MRIVFDKNLPENSQKSRFLCSLRLPALDQEYSGLSTKSHFKASLNIKATPAKEILLKASPLKVSHLHMNNSKNRWQWKEEPHELCHDINIVQ